MKKKIRWAVVGTGTIATSFAQDMQFAEGAELTAVYSRSEERGTAFAKKHGDIIYCNSLEVLLNNSNVDAIYLATPNSAHFVVAKKILLSGMPLLIEKPMTISAKQAEELALLAKKQKTFLMEALWSKYLPAIVAARVAIESGAIGTLTRFDADLAFYKAFNPQSRFFAKDLGGGSLLDLGVYTLAMAQYFLGDMGAVNGHWQAASTGVDMCASMTLHNQNTTAQLSCGFDRDGSNICVINGTKGAIILPAPFISANEFLVVKTKFAKSLLAAGNPLVRKLAFKLPLPGVKRHKYVYEGSGLQFEIMAASSAISQGLLTEQETPPSATLNVLHQIEQVLATTPVEMPLDQSKSSV